MNGLKMETGHAWVGICALVLGLGLGVMYIIIKNEIFHLEMNISFQDDIFHFSHCLQAAAYNIDSTRSIIMILVKF